MPTAAEYREQLKQLLPPGQAFPRDPGTTLHDLLDGMSIELARVDDRSFTLPFEANPTTTNELLSDWERVAGLPDRCSGVLEETLQGRRSALLTKLSSTGGQSPAYFISIAAALGYQVTITEFLPFRVGRSKVGEALTNGDWQFAWQVNAPETTVVSFRVGMSAVGEALRTWGAGSLECKIRQLAPAHTVPIFAYASSSLDLLFDSGTYLLNQQASSFAALLTFTRSTLGWCWNATGAYSQVAINQPRFDYDPITHALKGLLIEEARTNILQQSGALENAYWGKNSMSVTVSATPAPIAGEFLRLLTSTANGLSSLTKPVSFAAGLHTESFFVKAGSVTTCALRFFDAGGEAARATFDLLNGVITASSGAVFYDATITLVGDGLYRITLTANYTSRGLSGVAVYLYANNSSGSVVGDSILAWGAQLESGGFATSHIPTVASQITRAADGANVNNLAPWYNAAEGTLFAEVLAPDNTPQSGIASRAVTLLESATSYMSLYRTSAPGNGGADVVVAGASQFNPYTNLIAPSSLSRMALAIKANDSANSVNGSVSATDTNVVLANPVSLNIGQRVPNAFWNGHIKRVRYYPRRLTNTELMSLTAL